MKKDKHYKAAAEADPQGTTCFFCKKPNDHWDKEGWFYLWINPKKFTLKDGKAACRACTKGKPGKQHEKLHGEEDGNR